MTWNEKQTILNRMGHSNFESEEEYIEWLSELDNPQQSRIKKAMCDAEENGLPHFNWGRKYFNTTYNGNNNKTAKQKLPARSY